MFTHKLVDIEKSPSRPVLSDDSLREILTQLKADLAKDDTPHAKAELLKHEGSLRLPWWQRLSIPNSSIFTTSDHTRLHISDPGFLNRLGGQLTPTEGFILRPLPKWAYLEAVIPDLNGKSVLEIGCNNGFFCFEFAKRGAKQVLGLEVFKGFLNSALYMKELRKSRNVEFRLTDALLNLSLPKYDVVFMSEVYAHFVDPLFGLLKALNFSNEWLILDNATLTTPGYGIDLGAGVDPVTKRLTYHAWILSDQLILTYLYLCGVEPERIIRYFPPWANHVIYVIDTRNVETFRVTNDFQPCNTSFINMRWELLPLSEQSSE